MVQRIKLFDGTIALFDDDASPAYVQQKIKEYEAKQQPSQSLQPRNRTDTQSLPVDGASADFNNQNSKELNSKKWNQIINENPAFFGLGVAKNVFFDPLDNFVNTAKQPSASSNIPDFVSFNPRSTIGSQTGYDTLSIGDKIKVNIGMFLSSDDKQRMGVLKSAFGDKVNFRNTKDGVLATFTKDDGKTFDAFVNKKGWSSQDSASLLGTIIFNLPATGLIGKGGNLLGRVAVGAATNAATSAAQDLAVKAMGAKDSGISGDRALWSAILGGLFGGVAKSGDNLIASSKQLDDIGAPQTLQNVALTKTSRGWTPSNFWKKMSHAFGSAAEDGADDTMKALSNSLDDIAKAEGNPQAIYEAGEALQKGLANQRNAEFVFNGLPSWQGKAAALYDNVGIPMETRISMPQTKQAMEEILYNPSVSPAMTKMVNNPALLKILENLKNQKGQISYQEWRLIRSKLGDLLASDNAAQQLGSGAINKIYSAMTRDAETAAEALGKKQAFLNADSFYKEGMELWNGALKRLTKAETPEQAFLVLENSLYGTSSNAGRLQAVQKMLPPALWNDLKSSLIVRMGRNVEQGGEQAAFSATKYVKDYALMSPKAKDLLFGEGEVRSLMENLSKFFQSNVRSVKGALPLDKMAAGSNKLDFAVQGGGIAAMIYNLDRLVAGLGALGGWGLGKMMNSPKVLKILLSFAKQPFVPIPQTLNVATSSVRNSPFVNSNEPEDVMNYIESLNEAPQ